MTVEANQSPASGRPRYLYPALIASLAINLLFVGSFAAAVWHHSEDDVLPGHAPNDKGFVGFADQLSPDRQDPIRKEITAAREAMRDLRVSVRKSWLDANALLTAEPFDKAKFLAALMQLRDVEARYKTAVYNTVADTADTLTPDERKLLQKWRANRRPPLLVPPPPQNQPAPSDANKPATD